MKTSVRILRYLLRLGILVALVVIGGFFISVIRYTEGRVFVDGWEWVQGLGKAIAAFFVRWRYFLGIGAVLVLLVYGLWRVGWLRRRGGGFVLNRRCVLTDPYRHGLVVGSTGCGKTVSVVEPYLREALRSGHAGAVYDYKSPTLEGRLHFEASRARPRGGRPMPVIRTLNMVDARCSHRFDLLSTIRTPLHAQELAGAIITGGRTHRDSSDFFNQAAAGYLSSILYYYAVKYAGPQPVTLPHVFAILLTHETGDIVETLETDIESKMLLSTVRDSRGANEQMAGILATLKNHLTAFVSRDVFFALSGKESLAVNDPGSPRVLVLANGEEVRQALNPLISTVLKTLMRLINKPGKHPCIFCVDELASLYIPGLTDFLSTARSNRIAAFLGFQDFSQLEERYGKTGSDTILANCVHQIYGMNTSDGSARAIAGMFGVYERSYQTKGRSGSRGWLGTTRHRYILDLIEDGNLLSVPGLPLFSFLRWLIRGGISRPQAPPRVPDPPCHIPLRLLGSSSPRESSKGPACDCNGSRTHAWFRSSGITDGSLQALGDRMLLAATSFPEGLPRPCRNRGEAGFWSARCLFRNSRRNAAGTPRPPSANWRSVMARRAPILILANCRTPVHSSYGP